MHLQFEHENEITTGDDDEDHEEYKWHEDEIGGLYDANDDMQINYTFKSCQLF